MIRLTRINHTPMLLNSDLIEHVEITPDTVISLTTGGKFVVLESPEELVERIIEFRREIGGASMSINADRDGEDARRENRLAESGTSD
jgi:flagellar protein FlbD